MHKQVDFTKKIICSNPDYKVVQVIPVKFRNDYFTHALIIQDASGFQTIVNVTKGGAPSNDSVDYITSEKFYNPEPEIVRRWYQPVYAKVLGQIYATYEIAQVEADTDVLAIVEFITYDDGSVKTTTTPFKKD